ncbi:Ku protein [Phytoactinopolyspora limicola]|uniref:non-homologous end joining protein Ku n=1 Tax=Phytoactinopolyspora limicola TaxID=2715536 RepID=UPI00140CF114|nr:Ku protein [Phytoactinopolyspora limicola]
MARPVWTGSISFGLVNIGVALYSATQSRDVSFRQLEQGTGRRVRNKRVAEGTNREVEYEDITKGYETNSGDYVVVTQDELDSVRPDKSRSISVDDFVRIDEVDPIYFQRSYYVAPRSEDQEHAYALLREAMKEAGLAGVAGLVMRNKEHLVAIRPRDDVLVLSTMFYADEIRAPHDVVDGLPGDQDLPSRELDTAVQLIEQLSTEWKPEKYHDTHREQVLRLVEQKARGKKIEVEEPEEPVDNVIDLVAALEQSIEQAKGSSAPVEGVVTTESGGAVMAAASRVPVGERRL